jgi:uncharacterized protein YggE
LTTFEKHSSIDFVNSPLINSLKAPFLIILFIFVLLYGFAALFGPLPISVRSTVSTQSDLFTADGTGEVSATASNATFTVGVTETASTSEQASNQMNRTTNDIITALKNQGIKDADIKTTNYSVYPNQNYNNGQNNITGYTATQNLEVQADSVEQGNKALAEATAAGANTINGVSFSLNDNEKNKLQQEALKKAVTDAKTNAQNTANAAGIKLGRIVSIRQNQNNGGPVPMLKADMAAGGGVVTPNTQPGENTVTVNVTLSYETL